MQLHWCKEAGCLFVTCEKDTHASAWLEMFSFGSGDFLRGTEAHDVMSDGTSSGRWIPYNMSGPASQTMCLLEEDRKLPDHFKSIDVFNTATQTPQNQVHLFDFKIILLYRLH